MKTIVNSFSASGIFPVDVSRVLGPKVMLYDNSGSSTVATNSGANLAFHVLEAELTAETKALYQKKVC